MCFSLERIHSYRAWRYSSSKIELDKEINKRITCGLWGTINQRGDRKNQENGKTTVIEKNHQMQGNE